MKARLTVDSNGCVPGQAEKKFFPHAGNRDCPLDFSPHPRTRQTLLPIMIYAGLVLSFVAALAWLSWPLSFFSDDWGLVRIASQSASDLFMTNWHGLQNAGGFYRPLVRLTLHLNYWMGGYNSGPYHLTNILIHGANAFMVVLLGRALMPTSGRLVPYAASLLFLALPVHTDNVYWIAARTDSLCSFFYLATLIGFVCHLDRPTAWNFAGCSLSLLAALFSKEMAWSLPGALVLIAAFRRKLLCRSTILLLGFVALLYAAYFLLRHHVLGVFFGRVANNADLSPARMLLSFVSAQNIFMGGRWWARSVLLITLILGCISWRRVALFRDAVLLGLLVMVSLAPVLGLVMRWYLYVPSALACLLVARLGMDVPASRLGKRMAGGLLSAAICAYALVLVHEGFVWKRASRLSTQFVAAVAEQLQTVTGHVFVVNMPAGYLPADTVGEKPIFAYHFEEALFLHPTSGNAKSSRPPLTTVNFLNVLDDEPVSQILRGDAGGYYRVTCNERGFFAFHTDAFQPVIRGFPAKLFLPWGGMTVFDSRRLDFNLADNVGATLLFFDGATLTRL